MVWIVNEDKTATWLDSLSGVPVSTSIYGTLAGAAMAEGVQCSAFHRPFRKVALYETAVALSLGMKLPKPVEYIADYRVEFFDGRFHLNPLTKTAVRAARPAPLAA